MYSCMRTPWCSIIFIVLMDWYTHIEAYDFYLIHKIHPWEYILYEYYCGGVLLLFLVDLIFIAFAVVWKFTLKKDWYLISCIGHNWLSYIYQMIDWAWSIIWYAEYWWLFWICDKISISDYFFSAPLSNY